MLTMHTGGYNSRQTTLDREEWRADFVSLCYQCDLQNDQPKVFSGWVRPRSVFGLPAADLSFNSGRTCRTHRHARADGVDHYAALIALAGRSTLIQNDQAVTLGVGDIALVDKARPAIFNVCDNGPAEWLAVRLTRRTLIANFGFEPQAGLRAPAGTAVGRALVQLLQQASHEDSASAAQSEPYIQLAVYDMLGALFASTGPSPVSAHTHKLFVRVCDIIRNSFTDPDLGPSEVAAEARVSLRYLQKLFTARGLTCTHFIQSLRLDHARRLIRRRNRMNTGQPLGQIAFICGFRDYNYFARTFRDRFGHPPGAAGSDL
jgi:AraC family transcriptional activator of tynA and feaB